MGLESVLIDMGGALCLVAEGGAIRMVGATAERED